MVFHMVTISTYNKDNGWCWKYIKRWWIFGDTVDTPEEGIQQHRKQECLKSVINKGKAYLLGSKWTQEKANKASDKTINKTYAEYK